MGEQQQDDKRTMAFVGDSITATGKWQEWFPDDEIINFGVAGYTTDDVIASLDDVIESVPDEILMLIGTNDLGLRYSVEHLVRNVETVLVELRRELPGARMLVQSILPRTEEFAPLITDANIHLRQFSSTVRAQYLDLWPALATSSGALNELFTEDGLHLNSAGYEAWLEELRPGLERLRELPPMSRPLHVIDGIV